MFFFNETMCLPKLQRQPKSGLRTSILGSSFGMKSRFEPCSEYLVSH